MTDVMAPLSCGAVGQLECISNAETTAPEDAPGHLCKSDREPWNLAIIPRENRVGNIEDRKAGYTTHMCIWPGAMHVLKWLEEEHIKRGLFDCTKGEKIDVVEIGAGTGWMGMTLAANVPQAKVKMTDLGCAMPELSERVATYGGNLHNITVEECDWAQLREDVLNKRVSRQTRHDFIVGSELMWNRAGAGLLPYAFKALAEPGHTRIFYGHQPKYSPKGHARFLEVCAELNLTLIELARMDRPDVQKSSPGTADERPSYSDSEDDGAINFAMLFDDEQDKFANNPVFTIYEVLVPTEDA
eukprot:TRINITY_DN124109_c0_g1_i1.p1 TRINITY_DN124109_c0_g1~~TRINITY_DN124109_c0_g1_i1.p1  ORF type:complete len:324 (-),score=32.69 TRINITY_DN124109_c0_g1_i1:415-1314(-)